MALGVIGRKCGMTRVFQDDGQSVPVTVVEVLPNRVTCVKTADTDGYDAVQVTTGERHRNARPARKAESSGPMIAVPFGEIAALRYSAAT